MDRRTFLRRLGQAGALSAVPVAACREEPPPAVSAVVVDQPASAPPQPVAAPAPAPALAWFSEAEAHTARAIIDQLLPAGGAGLPGGNQVGVLHYMDGQLRLPHFKGLERMMRAGLQFVDRTARRDSDGHFHQLSAGAQAHILSNFQRGRTGGMRFSQAYFFQQFHSLALEGYLGDPSHGGNRDAAVWKALGFDTRCHHMYEGCS